MSDNIERVRKALQTVSVALSDTEGEIERLNAENESMRGWIERVVNYMREALDKNRK